MLHWKRMITGLIAVWLVPAGLMAASLPEGYKEWNDGAAPPPQLQPGQHMVQSGTGFFVTNVGHVVTNEHVVHGCKEVMIRGAVEPVKAKVVATDSKFDLALIKADVRPTRVAFLRNSEQNLLVNDPVLVMGYPLDAGATGQYRVKKSIISGLDGPMDEPQWIQFRDAALQGNSGGPLLDSSGNVTGVIVGKTRLVSKDAQTGEQKLVKQADVAIALGVLKGFLHKHNVYFRNRDSQAYYALDRVEQQAKGYIVNIHCSAK